MFFTRWDHSELRLLQIHSHLKSGSLFSYHPKTPEISFRSLPFTKGFVFPIIKRSEISPFFGLLARQDGDGRRADTVKASEGKNEMGGKQREEEKTYKWWRTCYLHWGWNFIERHRPSIRKKDFHVKTLDNPQTTAISAMRNLLLYH